MRGKSSMCMMCLKYRSILLIVTKNPWKYLLTYFLLRGPAPYPAGALTAPLRPQLDQLGSEWRCSLAGV